MESIENILAKYQIYRDWEDIHLNRYSVVKKKIKNNFVYEFFQILDESLDINFKPMVISVNPVESFIPFHYHNYVEIGIVVRGNPTIEIEKNTLELEPWDIFVVGANMVHKPSLPKKNDLVLNITLKNSGFTYNEMNALQQSGCSEFLINLLFRTDEFEMNKGVYALFKVAENDDIKSNVEQIIKEYYQKKDLQSSYIIRQELLILFSRLSRHYDEDKTERHFQKNSQDKLVSLLSYIEQNYRNASLKEMSNHFGFNPSYLSYYLKKETGYSFIKLLHIQRINIAITYLCYTNFSIEKITSIIGYENPSYFYKIFKKILKQSPQEFREIHKVCE